MPWEPDEQGRLPSAVLGLWLVVRDGELRAQLPDGRWLPTYAEEEREREAERRARLAAEDEVARLRRELERHQTE